MVETSVMRLRQRLLEERERHMREIDALVRSIPEDIVSPGDLSHLPTHIADRNDEALGDQAMAESVEAILERIEEALQRIDEGSYGTCERCGREIAEDRLEAAPYATLCLDCEEARERGEE